MKYLLFVAFIVVPIAEIATFIRVGDIIGLWPTLGIIVLTAFLGTGLLRYQGMATLKTAQRSLDSGELPLDSVIHGLFLLVAGLLLLTPGFITDLIGFLLFIPPLRLMIAQWALAKLKKSKNVHIRGSTGFKPSSSSSKSPIIEGEFSIADDDQDPPPDNKNPPKNGSASNSPWRQ